MRLSIPRSSPLLPLLVLLVACCLSLLGAASTKAAPTSGRGCERVAAVSLRACLSQMNAATRRCYQAANHACAADAAVVRRAVSELGARVRRACQGTATVQDAGFGPQLTVDALAARLAEACTGAPQTLASQSFGGPHAAVFRRSGDADQSCLLRAQRQGADLLERAFALQSSCVRRARRGFTCDAEATATYLAARKARAAARIDAACPDLHALVGAATEPFLDRVLEQARCLVPTAHGDTAPLALDCGPRAAVPVPPRATPVQVVLDEASWGTRCGDGSPYAFWIHLPPAGTPVENVLFFLQGGGVCVFESQCDGVSAGLLRALDNTLPGGGALSSTDPDNPFRDFTKVFLPYCTQDLHIGGGTTSVFPSRTIHRFGGRNVRAALRYVRDLLWAELDASSTEGYRPDRLRVFLTGTSAGGFGASYHFHYPIDELRWARVTAVPDSSLGLDNGELIGLRGLGAVFAADTGPLGWNALPLFPPYCKTGSCAAIPVLQEAHSLRLGTVPEQVFLNVSNQVDDTQVSTTFFPNRRTWIDALRAAYCETQGLPGVRYFLPAVLSSIHGTIANSSRFPTGLSSDGVTLGDWLGAAIDDAGGVLDRVEEGAIVTAIGAQPFACPVDG